MSNPMCRNLFQFIVPTYWLLANHSVTYFRCGPALWRQPWKSHKQTQVDEAWTTHGRAVGLPRQFRHFFSAVVRCYTLAHTVELTGDMVELMLPNGSNSSPQGLVVYVESTLRRHEEMSFDRCQLFTIISLDKAFEVTKVKVLHKGILAIFVWFVSIILTTFVEVWPQICCEEYFW